MALLGIKKNIDYSIPYLFGEILRGSSEGTWKSDTGQPSTPHSLTIWERFVFPSPSMRKQPTFGDATTAFPTKWRLRNERRNSILMTRHYTDLSSASDWSCCVGNLIQPVRSATQIWVVTPNQYGIFALVSQMSFGGETNGSVTKCLLFSQATLVGKRPQSGKEEEQLLRGQMLLFFGTLIVSNYYTNGFKLNAVSWNKVNVQIFSESEKWIFFIVLMISAVENGADLSRDWWFIKGWKLA